MTAWAVASDYAAYKGLPYPGGWDEAEITRIDAGLLSAQDDIAPWIRFSVYDLDDEATTTALTRATCARFDMMEALGDDGSGLAGAFDSVSIGTVHLGQNSTAAAAENRNKMVDAIGSKAASILTAAGFFTGVTSHR